MIQSAHAIEVKNLVKRFDKLIAVDGLSFSVRTGECLAILGPNGAGKTTTLEILEGLQVETEGDVTVLGMRWRVDAKRIRARIGVQLQETKFPERLTVLETAAMFRSFFKNGMTAEQAVALVRLEEKRDALVGGLSGGQKQRLALAVSLVGDPELVFLDEPTTGLDPQSRRALWDVVLNLKKRGRTLILTTHYMEEAEVLCDRVIVVDHGKIIAEGTPRSLISSLKGSQVIELHSEPDLAPETFHGLPGLEEVRRQDERLLLSVGALHEALPAVLERVKASGATLKNLSTREANLEDVFIHLTGRALREGA